MALTPEHDELQRKKAELEDELRSLAAKEKDLKENVKALEIKVEIRKLEDDLKAKREAVEKLESEKDKWALKLEKPASEAISEEAKPEEAPPEDWQMGVEEQETGVKVTAAPEGDEGPAQPQEEPKKEKRKRIFF